MSSAAVDVRDRVAARGLALDGAETFTSAGNGSGTFLDSSSSDSSDGRSSSSSCSTGGMLTRVTRGWLVSASCAAADVSGAQDSKIVLVGRRRQVNFGRRKGMWFHVHGSGGLRTQISTTAGHTRGCGGPRTPGPPVMFYILTSRLIDARKRWYARGACDLSAPTRHSGIFGLKSSVLTPQSSLTEPHQPRTTIHDRISECDFEPTSAIEPTFQLLLTPSPDSSRHAHAYWCRGSRIYTRKG